jgi:SAM-dependent methyltransferase
MMTRAADGATASAPRKSGGAEETRFILASTFRGLRRHVKTFAPAAESSSHWSEYTSTLTHYDAEQKAIKERFVRQQIEAAKPSWCLDVGANTGQFSEIAAQHSSVVAIDSDVASLGRIWRRAQANNLSILPLCVDICRPTPASGWRNLEQPSFLDRCAGRFDMVMMLAVMHHLLISERVPLDEIISLAAQLTSDHLIIEYVGPEDPMFRKLLRGRDALHAGYNFHAFETALKQRFQVVATCPVPGIDRTLFSARRSR